MLIKSKIASAAGIILNAFFAFSTSTGALAETLEDKGIVHGRCLPLSAIRDRDRVFADMRTAGLLEDVAPRKRLFLDCFCSL